MYYLEVLFIYGSCQLKTFHGPFSTPEHRERYSHVLDTLEQASFEHLLSMQQQGDFECDKATINMLHPCHVKKIPYDGPLPEGNWKKIPIEIPFFSCFNWYIEEEMIKFIEQQMRKWRENER